MSMFSFFSGSKKNGEIVLIFDIGSASVGGALVMFRPLEKPFILWSTRVEFPFQEKFDPIRFRRALPVVLRDLISTIHRDGLRALNKQRWGGLPRTAYCILSSPWYASQTRIVKRIEQIPFRITEHLINEMLIREIDTFRKESPPVSEGELALVEKDLIEIRLNGYPTALPHGKEARTMELSLFLSLTPQDVVQDISQAIRREFHLDNIFFYSFPLASFDVLRHMIAEEENFLFVDLSGEVTDVAIIMRGILREVTSFPVGKKTLVRQIGKILKTTPDEALTLVRLYQENKTAENNRTRVAGALLSAGNVWRTAFQRALKHLSQNLFIPSAVFFTADKDVEEWCGNLIRGEEFHQFVMSDEPFTISPLGSKILSEKCALAPDVSRDAFLMLESVFVGHVKEMSHVGMTPTRL